MIQGLHLLISSSLAELLYHFVIRHLLNGRDWIAPIRYSLFVPLQQSSLIALSPLGAAVRFVILELVYSLAKIMRPAVVTSMGNWVFEMVKM